jgi:hypothetical protein
VYVNYDIVCCKMRRGLRLLRRCVSAEDTCLVESVGDFVRQRTCSVYPAAPLGGFLRECLLVKASYHALVWLHP